ncbi:MAG: DnaA/Hda family protein [Pseudomonadota bacterium]
MKQTVLQICNHIKDWHKYYVVGKSNELVYKRLIQSSFIGLSPYKNFILLYGASGVGKTHLANVWRDKYDAVVVKSISDINKKKTFLLCEDIHMMPGEELFHIFNIAHESNINCLFTSSVYPYSHHLKDIESRIRSIMSIELDRASIDMIQKIFISFLNLNNIQYTLPALKSISGRLPNDVSKIKALVEQIHYIVLRDKTILNMYVLGYEEIQNLL